MQNYSGKYNLHRARRGGVGLGSLLLSILLVLFCGSFSFAQLSTVYVDALNGSDSFSGANPADTPPGSGPKATIHAGLSALADGGRLVLFAGVYAGDGVDTDGSATNPSDNADINISLTKYSQLTKGLIIELRSVGGSNEIRIVNESNTLRAPNGALISHDANQYIPNLLFNIPGGALTVVTTNGTEYLSLAGRHSSGSPVAGLFLVAGTLDIARGSSFRLLNGSTISITGPARFLREAPQKESDLNLTYLGSGTFSAGSEASYPSFGAGTLTVAKDSGTTVTFLHPTAFSGNNDAIRIQSGNAVFNGSVTLGSGGEASTNPRTADLVVSTSGLVAFKAPVALTVVNGTLNDSSISTINNAGSGTVSFEQSVTWYAVAAASNRSFPASETTAVIWNAGNGSMTFGAGIVLSHVSASGLTPATVEVSIQNDGRGSLKFGGPVQVVSRASTNPVGVQRFSAAVFNSGGGTLEISGSLGSRLVNTRSGQSAGTVNITGPTTLGTVGAASGTLVNARDAIVNLGDNTLTLSGIANHMVSGSYITSTSGGIVVDAVGSVGFDGGSLPRITIQQPAGGSTSFSSPASCNALTVNSGDCLLQSSVSIAGVVDISGGSLTLQDRAGNLLLAGSYRQGGGTFNLGGGAGGVLKILGNFDRTAGSLNAGSASSVVVSGSNFQTFDPGPDLQLGAFIVENSGGIVRCVRPLRVSANLTIGSGGRLELGTATILLNGASAVFANDGSFDASGLGIVLGGTSTLPGGASLSGSEIHAGPGSRFTSFTIDIGNGNTCALKAEGSVEWSGTLSLLSGVLDVASPIDLSPEGTAPSLVIDVLNSRSVLSSAGSFNRSNKRFTMRLKGTLLQDYTMQPELLADLLNVDTLDIEVNSDTDDSDGNLNTGEPRYLQLPSPIFVFGGSLVVGPLAAVRLQGDGRSGGSIELTGSQASHRVRGTLTTADIGDVIVIGGEKAALTGSALDGDAALVGNIAVRSTSLCRIAAIRGILGSLTTLPGSVLALSLGFRSTEQFITGSLILNGSLLSLEGNLEVRNGVSFNSGKLNFGAYNLQVSTSGDFLQGPAALGYEASVGSLVMNRPQGRLRVGTTEQLGLPNLHILAETYLDTPGRVTKTLIIGSRESAGIPTLFLGLQGNDLFFTGSEIAFLSNGSGNRRAIVSDGIADGTPGGRLFVLGTSVNVILDGDYSVEQMVYNPPAIDGTLSILSTDLTPRVLTISDILTHAGGQIGLGFNHLALAGTGVKPGCRAYNRSEGTLGASTGEVRFIGTKEQEFTAGESFSLPNLRISNPAGVSKTASPQAMIITRVLDLSEGRFTFREGTVVIENGATVIRRRSTALVSNLLSYRSSANIEYSVDEDNGRLTTALELPSSPDLVTNLHINNQNPKNELAAVALAADFGINGTLFLEAGELDLGSSHITLAEGATIEVRGGKMKPPQSASGSFTVSRYNLVYRKSAFVSSSSIEFQSGPSIQVERLSVIGSSSTGPTVLYLNTNRSARNVLLDTPGGGIEFGPPGSFVARNFTIKDSLTILAGGLHNTTGTNGIITLAGTRRQVLTLPDSGMTLPGGASAIHLQLNNSQGFLLRGGDLKLSSGAILFFVNGILDAGDRAIVLSTTATGQGFDRQGLGSVNLSHIIGTVRQSITGGAGSVTEFPNGRYEFPTGSATAYRPFVVSFSSAYPAKKPTLLEVSCVDQEPSGRSGLPLDGGQGSFIASVAPFYWRISTVGGSFDDDQKFNLETTLKNSGVGVLSISNLRFILRSAVSSESRWSLVGDGIGYGANSATVTAQKDTILAVRVAGVTSSLRGTNLLTVGLPPEKKPYLNFRVPVGLSEVTFGQPVSFRISISDPNGLPLIIAWKVNGLTVKSGIDTSFTYTFQSSVVPQSVRAVFGNTMGLSDSTEWNFLVVGVHDEGELIQKEFALRQNYPNPFNLATHVSVEMPKAGYTQLAVYTIDGALVRSLFSGNLAAGHHVFRWDGLDGKGDVVATGVYYCRLATRQSVKSIKMLLVK